tara:strand:- start:22771 stop:23736 length:966 start_codon:yes stop_codon:yes gene_type:complete
VYVLELAGEDDNFAAAEAQNAAEDVHVIAPGLATAKSIATSRISNLAYTHRVSAVLSQTSSSLPDLFNSIDNIQISPSGTIAVRARNVRKSTHIDTKQIERDIGTMFVDKGFPVDLTNPLHEIRVLFSDNICIVGRLVRTSSKSYVNRNPTKKPFFQPGSMDSVEARAIANLAGAGPNTILFDPMCGTGGILIEAALMGATVYGMDIQNKMAAGSNENLQYYSSTDFMILQGDAANFPISTKIDAILFDIPYGRQSKIAGYELDVLVNHTLVEAAQITSNVIVISDSFLGDLIQQTDWNLRRHFTRRVHKSLTRYIHILYK